MSQIEVPVAVVDGQIQVQPEINLQDQPKNVKLRWMMSDSTTDWVFADNGIALERTSDQFSDAKRVAGGREFQWKDKNDDGQTYKYDVNLVAADGSGRTLSLDPLISNGGGGGGIDKS